MTKYLVIYEQEESYNCSRNDVTKIERFDDIDKAIKYITELIAFKREWRVAFDMLAEIKEIPVDIPVAEIEKVREKERLRKKNVARKAEADKEKWEREKLKKLKEKYEK